MPALHDRLQALAAALAARHDTLALLALGSVGRDTERMDRWSDLDFFVLVRDGAKAHYLADLGWLAAVHPLAWHYRNTVDGHKALMADGVFCEFAIFELRELAAIPYAPGRFVWRRDEVPEGLALPQRPLPQPSSRDWLLGEALSSVLVGLQRHARGERLSAMRAVQVAALDRVLELRESLAPAPPPARDPYAIDRRIESRWPQRTAWIAEVAPGYASTPQAALALLAELESLLPVPAAVAARIRWLAQAAADSAVEAGAPRDIG